MPHIAKIVGTHENFLKQLLTLLPVKPENATISEIVCRELHIDFRDQKTAFSNEPVPQVPPTPLEVFLLHVLSVSRFSRKEHMKHHWWNRAAVLSIAGLALTLPGATSAAAADTQPPVPDFAALDPTQVPANAKDFPAKACARIGAQPAIDGWLIERPFPGDDNAFHSISFADTKARAVHILVIGTGGVKEFDPEANQDLLKQLQTPGIDLKAVFDRIPTKAASTGVSGFMTAGSFILHTPAGWTLAEPVTIFV